MTSTFGQVVGRDQVGQAVLKLFQTPPPKSAYPLFLYYLAEVERQESLLPRTLPIPQGYRTGLDFENWTGTTLPMLAVVAQPSGSAERYGQEGSYGQWFEIQVCATVEDPASGDEQTAQTLADRYGSAVMLCLVQNGGLGSPGFTVDKTDLVSAPRTELIPDAQRWLARSIVTVHSFVEQVVQEAGPTSFGPDPYATPQPLGTVSSAVFQFKAQDPLNNLSPGSGVSVSDDDADIIVNE